MAPRLGAWLLAGLAIAACAPGPTFGPDVALAVENRTNAPLALPSGRRIPACDEVVLTENEVLEAHQAQRFPGAVGLNEDGTEPVILALPTDIAIRATTVGTVVAIVTDGGTEFVFEGFDRSQLPPCT